jgi:hypothetical protein
MTQARSHKTTSAGDSAGNAVSDIFSAAAASPMRMAQSVAQESFKFWARRMHAYAQWAEAAAASTSPQQLMEAQSAFLARAQKDYAQESAVLAETLASAATPPKHAS